MNLRDVADLLRVLRSAPIAEGLRQGGPLRAVQVARREGRWRRRRSESEKVFLGKAIRVVDAAFADGGNCFRRVLIAALLDPDAAASAVIFGFDEGLFSPGSGHAWLADDEAPSAYAVRIQL